ncbi:MAG: response regulator [Oscillospiraceae bacterium]|nr:response regulator [Oscillospiraceae bacterium]
MQFEDMSVLICDDSLFVRKKLRDYLLSLKIKAVHNAADGQEAVDKYKEHTPSLVLMDIVMPKKTGVQALGEIMEFDKNAKVVMVSSVGTQSNLAEAISAGAFEFIQKPIENEQVLKILESIAKG